MAHATYEMQRWHRPLLYVPLALAASVAVSTLTSIAAAGFPWPPVAFLGVWLAIFAWSGYWLLFRLCYRLELDDHLLRWYTPLRQGDLPLSDLREIAPSRVGSKLQVLRTSRGESIPVALRKGFATFASAVNKAAPHVHVRLGRQARLAERMPGRGGFES